MKIFERVIKGFANIGSRHRWRRYAAIAISIFLFFLAARVVFELTVDEVAVFGFHDIIDLENPAERPPQRPEQPGDYTKQDFSTFLEALIEENYWFLTAQDLYDYFLSPAKKPLPPDRIGRKKVAIALDDGYKSAHQNAIAVLEDLEARYQRKIKLIWFVNPAFLGVPGTVLDHATCEELRDGFERGFYDLQSHGAHHQNLTELEPDALEKELVSAQEILQSCLAGVPTDRIAQHISYPFGKIDRRTQPYVAKHYRTGYLYDGTTLKLHGFVDRYRLPRIVVNHDRTPERLLWLARGGWL